MAIKIKSPNIDTQNTDTIKRSDGFAGDRGNAIGWQRDISKEIEREQKRNANPSK